MNPALINAESEPGTQVHGANPDAEPVSSEPTRPLTRHLAGSARTSVLLTKNTA